MLYQNYLREFWCSALVVDLNPSTDDSKARPLKELSIKFTVNNGMTPLTLNYQTFCQTRGLEYNNGNYVANPSTEEVKAELAKIANHEALVQNTPVLKTSFPVTWRIMLTFVIQVLGENHSSTEQLNLSQQFIDFSLLTWTKIDIGEIIHNDLVARLMAKSRQKYVSYPRFIACSLERLLSYKYPQDKKFGTLPPVLSQSIFSKNPSEVIATELMAFVTEVINHQSSVSPLPASANTGKKKTHTVTKPKPKSQGPEASGAPS
ncbi:hypothetical protein Tco_0080438 [Tanacetum coccineum]